MLRYYARRMIQKLGHLFISLGNRVYQTPQEKRVVTWLRDQGDRTLRLTYDLDENSTVFDLGGYEGQWSSDIFAMYLCHIHIFEPVPQFADQIQHRFSKNDKVKVYQLGLSDKNDHVRISIDSSSSSIYKSTLKTVEVNLVRAIDFLKENHIQKIDLLKINIEGAEYDLLDHLIATDFIGNITDIQIQFHDFVPDAENRMKAVQKSLAKTHKLTYQYPFVWENWRLTD